MSRSKWKGPFINATELNKIRSSQDSKKKMIISRNSEIVPSFVGFVFSVHNGKVYSEINVNENMIGHKFGEFSFTRTKFIFKKKKTKK
jgi:small subunit ribosomal protein S19